MTAIRWCRCSAAPALARATRSSLYFDNELTAVRQGPWKLHLKTIEAASGQTRTQVHSPPLLFNLEHDPSERFNVAPDHPDVVQRLMKVIEEHRAGVVPGTPQL